MAIDNSVIGSSRCMPSKRYPLGCLHRLGAPDREALPVLTDLQAKRRSIRLSWAADPVLDPMLPQEGRELPAHGGAVLAVHHVPSRP